MLKLNILRISALTATFIGLVGMPPPSSAEVTTYRYDALGRLTVSFRRDGPSAGLSVRTVHDAADNRQSYNVENVTWTLQAGQSRFSPDGRFRLDMQSDGNLVLYIVNGAPLWGSNTLGLGGTRATFQTDGNLVIYTASGQPVWGSGTSGNWGSAARIQNDGNFVIYSEAGSPTWATETGGH